MIDRVEITAKAGDGGNGAVSFRREKFVPLGGPDGGDGGNGGALILKADPSVRTLLELGRRRIYRADRGVHGLGAKKHGANGEDLVLRVPVGTQATIVKEDGAEELAGDLVDAGMAVAIVRGGKGGWGNSRFATSTHQAPRIAQRGQKGEEVRLRLDLKLLADVGIVGLPNAGKSTLLTNVSAARPKIGAYPFTTLEPQLGVVDIGWERFVVADIPGLIEGAHEGAGLGLDFLRHIERTRLMIHLVDGSSSDPWGDMQTVNQELGEYGEGLEGRPQIVAINKIDIPEVAERADELRADFESHGITPHFISAASGEGVEDLMRRAGSALHELQGAEPAAVSGEDDLPIVRPLDRRVRVSRQDGAFRVEGDREVAFAEMMPLDSDEGCAELWRRFVRWGVVGALKRAGAKRGDTVLIGSVELEMEA